MLDKVKNFLFTEEDEDYEYAENDFVAESNEAQKPKPAKIVKLKAVESETVISEPLSYSESQSIADYILANRSIIINLHKVTPDQAKRIIDFLSGTVYAIDGTIKKIGDDIFLAAPNNVSVTGEIGDHSKEIEID